AHRRRVSFSAHMNPSSRDWHAREPEAVLESLDAQRSGLDPEEAQARLERHGPNRLPEAERVSPFRRFFRQFHNLLIYVLMASAAIALLLEHLVDALVILAVVLLNAVIGFVQEGRAEQAI